ncbi:MAG: PilZ domain-containing protein [Magnetococcales bacterium]|nr:PilZ domain-containing protein [Magnetococcales bacterium]
MSKEDNKTKEEEKNRRLFSRVPYRQKISLTTEDNKTYPGSFDDISLKGMLFLGDKLPEKGSILTGNLVIGEAKVAIKGEVTNVTLDRGAAIKFIDMDVESFTHLRQLVALNMGDAELIDAEFFSSL